jgi:hypothetical protein
MQQGPRDPFTVGPRQYLHQLLNILTVLRAGDYRFLPFLLGKVHDILPKMVNPMLPNAPENAKMCNVDIFDGFGNAGMAQPAVFSTEEYDNKFAMPRIEELSNDSGSNSGSAGTNNEMNSPFVSSPAIMSPNLDMQHGLQNNYNNMSDIINPMARAAGSSIGNKGSIPGQQAQQQHPLFRMQSMTQPPSLNLTTQNLNMNQGMQPNSAISNGLGSPMAMNGGNMMSRQQPQPQRTNSFAMTPQGIRTIGDFHAVQRANSDMGGIGPMGTNAMNIEMDFNTMPR